MLLVKEGGKRLRLVTVEKNEQINEENSKHEDDDMENEESGECDDDSDEDSGDDSEEEALAERRRVRYGMIFNFLAKNKTHEELVVIQQKLQQ